MTAPLFPPDDYMSTHVGHLLRDDDVQYSLPRVTTTGFVALDEVMAGGWRAGEVALVAGVSGVGTSTLALNFAVNAAKSGTHTLFLAPDTNDAAIRTRVIASESRIDARRLRRGADDLSDEDSARLASKREALTRLPLWILAGYSAQMPTEHLLEAVTYSTEVREFTEPTLVVIDGTSVMEPNVREAIVGLRQLAHRRFLSIVVTTKALVPEGRRLEPRIDDLVEHDACVDLVDMVMFVHRDDHLQKSTRVGEADMMFMKHRYGTQARVTLAFQGHLSRFVSIAS